MSYTTILHAVRKQFGLTCNEYCVADMVRGLSGNPDSPIAGWCNASRQYLADELDLTRQSIITIIAKLEEKKLIEQNEAKHLRPTSLFYAAVTGCKESLQGVKKLDTLSRNLTPEQPDDVKKLDTPCQESLQQGCQETLQEGVKKLDTIIIEDNNKEDNTTDNLKKESANADAPVLEEVDNPEFKKKKKEEPPKVPQNPPPDPPKTVVTRIREIVEFRIDGYYWSGKDGGAASDIAKKLRTAILKKSAACTDDDVINAFIVLLDRTSELPPYFQFTDLPALNGKFNEILTQLRIPRTNNGKSGLRSVAPAHQSAEQRIGFINDVFAAIDSVAGK